jgi:type IV pilus assembly protein PilM
MLEFLTLHPNAFGLDISDMSLKFVYLKKSARRIHIASFGECPIPEGVILEGEIKKEEELTALVVKSLETPQGEKILTKHVIASLPEEQAFLQVIQLPKMDVRELQGAASFEAENYIPYPLETVYVDSEFVEPVKDHLDHADVLLASLPRTTVDSYVSVFEKAGLLVQALEIESLAVARALVPQGVSLVPLLLMDLGATRTSFLVFAGHSLRFTASIPVASHQFTEAISKAMGVQLTEAEELKKTYGLERRGKSEGGRYLRLWYLRWLAWWNR